MYGRWEVIELEDMSAYLGLSTEECSSSVLLPVTVADTLHEVVNLVHHYSPECKSSRNMFKAFVDEFEKFEILKNASSHFRLMKWSITILKLDLVCGRNCILYCLHHAALANLSLNEPNFSNWNYERIDVNPKDLVMP